MTYGNKLSLLRRTYEVRSAALHRRNGWSASHVDARLHSAARKVGIVDHNPTGVKQIRQAKT